MKSAVSVLAALILAAVASGCADRDRTPAPAPAALEIHSVSPAEGSAAGGTAVTILGAGFEASALTAVSFGAVPGSAVTVLNSGAITCEAPAQTAGTVGVTVTNPGGESFTLGAAFNYAAAPLVASQAFSLGAVDSSGSGFPPDMCVARDPAMSRTLFAVDDAEVGALDGAKVLAVNMDLTPPGADSAYTTFALGKTDLLHPGGSAVGASDTFGSWGLEAAADDLLVVHSGLAFLLVSSSCENDPPYLADLAVFKPSDGSLLQVLNVALQFTPPGGSVRSDGTAIASSFVQTNPSGLAYVPGLGTQGRLYVSMSNLHDSSGFPRTMVYNPGTIMAFDVDTSLAQPVTAAPASTLIPSRWNPVHLTHYPSAQSGCDYVLVTEAGITTYYGTSASYGYSPPYQYVCHTDAAVEIIDAASSQFLSWDPGTGSRTTIDLGPAAPSLDDIAIAADPAGGTAGLLGSSFYGRIYAIDISGLDQYPAGAAGLRPLRNAYNPVQVFSHCGSDHDFASSVSVSPDGGYAMVSDFNGAAARVVALPANWVTGEFAANPEFFETPLAFTALDGGLPRIGKLLFRSGTFAGPEAFVLVSNVEPNFMSPTNLKFGAVATVDFHGRVK